MGTTSFFVFVLCLSYVVFGSSTYLLDKIDKLPGQPVNVDFDQYSGYVNVNKESRMSLFYWLTESPANRNPETKPLLLWLNGGPGCSLVAYGVAEEIGHLHINSDSLYANTYSWNKFTAPSPIPYDFLVSQHTWHQRLGHPGGEVLRRLVSSNFISQNKEKTLVLCHACQLGKYVRLPLVSSSTVISSCFDIIHSDVWTSPIPSLSGFKYYVLFLDYYSQFVSVYPLVNKSDVMSKFMLFRNYVRTQFKCEIKSFQCDHGDGTLSHYKARLVANGSTQLEGVDVDETFSLVVKQGTIRIVLSLAASRRWPIHQLDFIRSLHQEFAMTDLGPLNYFLGISVTCDSSGLFLSQKKYAVEILDRAHMVNCNPSQTSIDTESKIGSDGDIVVDLTLYQSLA
nr:serine carboxypeptidase-like 27 [Tanacetum cinerariifolium]